MVSTRLISSIYLISIFCTTDINAQYADYINTLAYGSFGIGHTVETIYDSSFHYTYNNYNGALPFQINVWFPADTAGKATLSRKNYLDGKRDNRINGINDSIDKYAEDGLLRYGICFDFSKIRERKSNERDIILKNAILEKVTKASTCQNPKPGKWPCIFYHHGAGGASIENVILFEYLASCGFVVIASNYHWPVEKQPWGSLIDSVDREVENTLFVLNTIKNWNYIDSTQLYYLGHSWGGQVGLKLNTQNSLFKSFIILETTLEQAPLTSIPEYWPDLYDFMESEKEGMIKPTYFFCSKSYWSKRKWIMPRFEYFRTLTKTPKAFITYSTPLNHSSFTDAGVMRAEFTESHKQKDANIIRDQYNAYLKICKMVRLIIEKSAEGNQIDFSSFPLFLVEHIPSIDHSVQPQSK